MSICPGCGRCRECGQRTAPAPVYPWFGPWPYSPTVPQPPFYPWVAPSTTGAPFPSSPYTITVTNGTAL